MRKERQGCKFKLSPDWSPWAPPQLLGRGSSHPGLQDLTLPGKFRSPNKPKYMLEKQTEVAAFYCGLGSFKCIQLYNRVLGNILQYIHVSKQQAVDLKNIQFLFIN